MALGAAVLLACAACASDADQPAAPQATAAPNGPAAAAAAPAAAEPAAPAADEMIAVTGRVVVTGSDPLVTLVIVTGANEQYELVGEQADPLWDLQQRRVTVNGYIVQPASGPGFPAQLEVASYALARERG